jgi:hypothetical protein
MHTVTVHKGSPRYNNPISITYVCVHSKDMTTYSRQRKTKEEKEKKKKRYTAAWKSICKVH